MRASSSSTWTCWTSRILRREEHGWRLYLNRQDAPQRRVFTLAHLLGHFFLHAATADTFVESPFAGMHGTDRRP